MSAQRPLPTIVIPVYNALSHTQACVDSLRRTLTDDVRVVLVNDGSTDPGMRPYLAALVAQVPASWTIVDRTENWGFTRTVNQGLRLVAHDAVILNSDTRVTYGWLERLQRAAYHKPGVASVTPFSNAATICSVFEYCAERPLPAGLTEDDVQQLLSEFSPRLYPQIPTGVGFCMYMTHEAMSRAGLFDELGFPRGYGEENDWCERAKSLGFTHHLCDDTFIFHQGSASFKAERAPLAQAGTERIKMRWPTYFPEVAQFIAGRSLATYPELMKQALKRVALRIRAGNTRRVPRVLQILHSPPVGDRTAGTEYHVQQLAAAPTLNREFEQIFAWVQDRSIVARTDLDDPSAQMVFATEGDQALAGHRGNEAAWKRMLTAMNPDMVHVHHTVFWGVEFVRWLMAQGVPVGLTAHDHYFMCPRWNLLNAQTGDYCGLPKDLGVCARCLGATQWRYETTVTAWRQAYADVIGRAAFFNVPSQWIADRLAEVYPQHRHRATVLGHALWPEPEVVRRPTRGDGEALRVLILGYAAAEKGHDLIGHIAHALPDMRFLALGSHWQTPAPNIEMPGFYGHSNVHEKIRQQNAHVALFLSRTPESYSYTFSEAVANGLPVVVPHLGALAERAAALNAGWTYEMGNADSAVATLRYVDSHRAEWAAKVRGLVNVRPGVSLDTYGEQLAAIYKQALARHADQALVA